jgi:hypothetical protein
VDWENERYVRLYVRDTADILAIGWEGRALFSEILRKVDRAGLFDSDEPEVISELIRMPVEIVSHALTRLVGRGMVERIGGMLLIPNFLDAQEAKSSESQRSREHRARRRDQARAGQLREDTSATIRDEQEVQSATIRDGAETIRDEHPDPCDENVTPCCAVPSVPSEDIGHRADVRARSTVTKQDLESVYAHYPKKVKKAKGIAAAKRIIRTREEFEKFEKCVLWMEHAWAGADTTFCPGFEAFANGQRWNDEEWPAPSKGPTQGGMVSKLNLVTL